MNYEEKYKTALERAKGIINYYKSRNRNEAAIEDLQEIFPELKESEDEKIRETLIKFHKSTIDIDGIIGHDIISWLEKQGKKELNTEDRCIIQDTISICERARKKATNEIDYENVIRCIDWLKSLKDRHTWKPSKEQMDTLLFISSVLKDEQVIVNLEELKTLYNDLKKL